MKDFAETLAYLMKGFQEEVYKGELLNSSKKIAKDYGGCGIRRSKIIKL